MLYRFGILICLFFSLGAFKTASAQTEVQAETNTNRILLGEEIKLKITVILPAESPSRFVKTDSFPHFETIKIGAIDSVINVKGKQFTQEILLTSFDSGRWSIPPFTLEMEGLIYRSDSIPIDVTFTTPGGPENYTDVKDIIVVTTSESYLWWIAGAILLAVLLLLFLWWRKKRKRVPEITRYEHLSAYDEAMKLLDDLEKEKLSSKDRYTRLTYIFRIYLHRKNGWNALNKSSLELFLELEQSKLSKEEYIQLGQTLRLSNLAKFAKYEPASETDIEQIAVIRSTIKKLNSES